MLNGQALSEQERRWVGAACLGMSTSVLNTSDARQQSRRGVRVREAVIADLEEATSTSASLIPHCASLGMSTLWQK